MCVIRSISLRQTESSIFEVLPWALPSPPGRGNFHFPPGCGVRGSCHVWEGRSQVGEGEKRGSGEKKGKWFRNNNL